MGQTALVLQLLSDAGTLGAAVGEAGAQRAQSRMEQRSLRQQEKMAAIQERDAIERGRREAGIARRRGEAVLGAQRARLAGQGVDVTFGSAADTQMETRRLTDAEVATIRNNAAREALGFRLSGIGLQGERKIERKLGKAQTRQTLLTGGAAFARSVGGRFEDREDRKRRG